MIKRLIIGIFVLSAITSDSNFYDLTRNAKNYMDIYSFGYSSYIVCRCYKNIKRFKKLPRKIKLHKDKVKYYYKTVLMVNLDKILNYTDLSPPYNFYA